MAGLSEYEEELKRFGVCCFCIVFITSIILFSVSFGVVDTTEVAIVFDGNVQHIQSDKTIYSGRYLVGLGKRFITFPSTYETIVLSNDRGSDAPAVVCRSYDGLPITLSFAFQYLISRDVADLTRLYMDTQGAYEKIYVSMAQQASRDVCSNYFAFDFFTRREEIAHVINAKLNNRMSVLYASVPALELLEMQIPEKLANAIEDTQIAVQDVFQAQYEQLVATISADQSLLVATALSQVQLQAANATARTTLATARANADTLLQQATQQVSAYIQLRDELNLTSPQQLLGYLWSKAAQESNVHQLVYASGLPPSLTAFSK